MKLSPLTLKMLSEHVASLAQASRDLQGIGLAAKTMNWPGLHKVAMVMSKKAHKAEHETIKLVRDYGEDLTDLPAVRGADCSWPGYVVAWERLIAIAVATQQGWKDIASGAEERKDTDVDDYADHYLRKGTDEITQFNRWLKFLEQADADEGGKIAAFKVFDEKRG